MYGFIGRLGSFLVFKMKLSPNRFAFCTSLVWVADLELFPNSPYILHSDISVILIALTKQTEQFFPSDFLFDAAMSYVKNVCINQIVVLEHFSSAKMHVYKYSTLYLYDDDM